MRYTLLDNIQSLKNMVRIDFDYVSTNDEFWKFVDYIIKGLNSINWFENKHPRTVLGGVIYWCFVEKKCHVTQEEMAFSLGICSSGIRKHYHELKKYMDINYI